MRRANVSKDRVNNQQVNGEAMLPMKVRSPLTAASTSARPTTAPAIRSEWPERYLVAEYTDRSAPHSNGFCQIGPM